jgi:hypothetical protein
MQARRLLGIERADFNYDTEPEKEEKPPRHLRKNTSPTGAPGRKQAMSTKRRLHKKKLAVRQQLLLLQGDVCHHQQRGSGRDAGDHQQPAQQQQLDEFNVDSIECLVDNEPVEDGEGAMMEQGQGLAFPCPFCDLR